MDMNRADGVFQVPDSLPGGCMNQFVSFENVRVILCSVLSVLVVGYASLVRAATPHVVIGYDHMLLLASNGTVTSWGGGGSGQLGRGTDRNPAPAAVSTLGNSVISVTAGASLSAAVKDDGTVWVWGNVSDGRSGRDTVGGVFYDVPTQVPGVSNMAQVLASPDGSTLYATDRNGQIWSWGDDYGYGNLGLGRIDVTQSRYRSQPQLVAGATGQLAVAGHQMMVLKSDASLLGWGSNDPVSNPMQLLNPVLGNGVAAPGALRPGGFSYIDMSPTGNSAPLYLGIKGGEVQVWGDTAGGAVTCGQANPVTTSLPFTLQNSSGVRQVAGGGGAYLLVDGNGTLTACGNNSHGLLGDGTLRSTEFNSSPALAKVGPVPVRGLPGPVARVYLGDRAAAALMPDGSVYTWGKDSNGLLGLGTSTESVISTPQAININAGVVNPSEPGNPGGTGASLSNQPTMSASLEGPLSAVSLKAVLGTAPAHLGRAGSVFLALVIPGQDIVLFNSASSAFEPLQNGVVPAAFSGTLPASLPLLDVRGANLTPLAGTVVYVGYGLGANPGEAAAEMLIAGRLWQVFNLQ